MNVSVAMCTYNGEKFLAEQLHSIQQQSYPPAELVVCDDGSTDNTASIVDEFARTVDFPVRWHRNEANLGSTLNFAQAIRMCTGDAIALCDQDDRWFSQKLDVCVRALEADSDVAGVFSNAELIDERGAALPGSLWGRVGFDRAAQKEFAQDGAVYLARRDTVTGAAFVFRAKYADLVLPPPVEWVHDGWIAYLLASLARVSAVPEALMAYRLHASQQVGATVVPLHAHLRTERQAALQFHQAMARRFALLTERLSTLKAQGAVVDPAALEEAHRKRKFEQTRSAMLESTPIQRILPGIARLADYARYEKGLLSLLRDLTY